MGNSPSTYQQIVDNFNIICTSLPRITSVDETRKDLINKSFSIFQNIEVFTKAFKKAQDSDFLSERNEKWKCCSFDWIISEGNMMKILKGNYDNKLGKDNAKDSFNNYEQRNYDYGDLEKKLLGWEKGR